ncbi:hypothetical protein BH10ACT3_BH10ACT3_14500 [soil metagenome]
MPTTPANDPGSTATHQRRDPDAVRTRAIWALTGYLIGVFLARVVTTVLHLRGAGANGGLIIHGVHIHHAIFGLIIMSVVTIMWMLEVGVDAVARSRIRRWTAAFWGFAWALILDEFALLLHLKDVYWLPQGEESLYALFLFGVVLIVTVVVAPDVARREHSLVEQRTLELAAQDPAGGRRARPNQEQPLVVPHSEQT